MSEQAAISYAELKQRSGVHEFTLSRAADDPRGKVRFLQLHGGTYKMEVGKSRVFKFSLPAEARTLAQLAEDGYLVEEGGPPIPEELPDAFANPEEVAAEPPAKARKSKQTTETTEG